MTWATPALIGTVTSVLSTRELAVVRSDSTLMTVSILPIHSDETVAAIDLSRKGTIALIALLHQALDTTS